MIIHPKVRGFICTTAHPQGCEVNVAEQINYTSEHGNITGCKNALIIGSSTGYGLSSRIVASFACGANTVGVCFERPSAGKRTASAGWYNTAAFEKLAKEKGYKAATINGDAYSDEVKQQTIDVIKKNFGKIDLVIYSLASPKRTDPKTGEVYNSCLKTIGENYHSKSLDPINGELTEAEVEPASDAEIAATVKVMGGEDWQMWMDALRQADVLAPGVITLAYSYVGPKLTYPIYREGTIGHAKLHLEKTADNIQQCLTELNGQAFVSVNKAVVTQASSAIPIVPLYMSILFKVMKEKNNHEGTIEQIYRMFRDFIYTNDEIPVDAERRIRLDDWEMRDDVQNDVAHVWNVIDKTNMDELMDLDGYQQDFYNLFGFGLDGIDYDAEVDPSVAIPSLETETA